MSAPIIPALEYFCLIVCKEDALKDAWWKEPYRVGNPFTKAPRWSLKIEAARKRWPQLSDGE